MNDSGFDAIYNDCDEVWDFDLLTASAVGDEESVVHLLQQVGLDQGLRNSKGWTPIMFAAYFGHSHLVSLIMANKLFNVRDKNDRGLFQFLKHF
jgi:hypothetical protein